MSIIVQTSMCPTALCSLRTHVFVTAHAEGFGWTFDVSLWSVNAIANHLRELEEWLA